MEEVNTESEEVSNLPAKSGTTIVPQERPKFVRLPLARIKHMMKMDPDCHITSQDAVFLVTKATEQFLECLSRESFKFTHKSKRKTILRRDVDAAIESIPHLCFLDGTLD